jgi:iron-regulated transporter 1
MNPTIFVISAARYSLVIQNCAVILGATTLAFTLHFRSDIKSVWSGGLEYTLYAVIIFIALIAELASVANKIALEKDWIVVLAGGDVKRLASE